MPLADQSLADRPLADRSLANDPRLVGRQKAHNDPSDLKRAELKRLGCAAWLRVKGRAWLRVKGTAWLRVKGGPGLVFGWVLCKL